MVQEGQSQREGQVAEKGRYATFELPSERDSGRAAANAVKFQLVTALSRLEGRLGFLIYQFSAQTGSASRQNI
ncbi:hypothetical protein [Methylocella sp.]|jgi:hypothetical protein|uniref:hypothetical protein n=1 Tax=Methylocella sp. TaxID=1978226 RepID=UPI003C22D319